MKTINQPNFIMPSLRKITLSVLVIPFLAGCAYKERDQLKEQNAQLQKELQK
jgi:hypothetical protein